MDVAELKKMKSEERGKLTLKLIENMEYALLIDSRLDESLLLEQVQNMNPRSQAHLYRGALAHIDHPLVRPLMRVIAHLDDETWPDYVVAFTKELEIFIPDLEDIFNSSLRA